MPSPYYRGLPDRRGRGSPACAWPRPHRAGAHDAHGAGRAGWDAGLSEGFAAHARPPAVKPGSHVKVRDAQRVLLDELAPRLDDVAHELDENVVGLVDLADLNLQKGSGLAVE